MSETQQSIVHTPGPWHVHGGWGMVVMAGDKTIVSCRNPTLECDEADANAKLIALSPDMLSAIQGALRIADLWRPCGDWPGEHWEEAKALNAMFSQFEEITRKVV